MQQNLKVLNILTLTHRHYEQSKIFCVILNINVIHIGYVKTVPLSYLLELQLQETLRCNAILGELRRISSLYSYKYIQVPEQYNTPKPSRGPC